MSKHAVTAAKSTTSEECAENMQARNTKKQDRYMRYYRVIQTGSTKMIIWKTQKHDTYKVSKVRPLGNPPRLWRRYVNDTFVGQEVEHKEQYLQHINNLDHAIKFTVDGQQIVWSKLFLDTIMTS